MELLVLTKLRWELSAPTSLQFLSILLVKMEDLLSEQMAPSVQKEAETFLMLAATEYKFHNIKPSVLVSLTSDEGLTHTISHYRLVSPY